MFEFSFIKKWQEAKEKEAKRLEENPEDSSSGKRFKQLYKVGDNVSIIHTKTGCLFREMEIVPNELAWR